MRRVVVFAAAVAVFAACGGSTEPDPIVTKPKPDPWLTIRLANFLDTTTKAGRANWVIYLLLSGPYPNQNGIGTTWTFTMTDARLNRHHGCFKVGADSIGQRLVSLVAFGDTTERVFQGTVQTDSIIHRWYAGNHTEPAGYVAFVVPPIDAWDSQQYAAGHGRITDDPIKWEWKWENGSHTFSERLVTDGVQPICDTY